MIRNIPNPEDQRSFTYHKANDRHQLGQTDHISDRPNLQRLGAAGSWARSGSTCDITPFSSYWGHCCHCRYCSSSDGTVVVMRENCI